MFRTADHYEDFINLAIQVEKLRKKAEELAPLLSFPGLAIPGEEKLEEKFKKLHTHDSSDEGSSRSSFRSSKKKRGKKKGKKSCRRRRRSTSNSSSDASASSSSEESSASGRHSRANPVLKWVYRFGKGEDLHEFLREVQDAADLHKVRDMELIQGMSALLTGAAKTWYRSNRYRFTTWNQLKRGIKEAFSPADDDDEVTEKLNKLRQHSDETFAVYEAKVEELSCRRSEPLTDKQRLKLLLKGLHLYYRSRIRSVECTSVRRLRKQCGELERDKTHLMKLEREERGGFSRRNEDDRANRDNKYHRDERRYRDQRQGREDKKRYVGACAAEAESAPSSSSEEVEREAEAAAVGQPKSKDSFLRCYKCFEPGHIARECAVQIFCIVCGMPDTTAYRCQNCAKLRAEGRWQGLNPEYFQKLQENKSRDLPGGAPVPWTTIPPPQVASQTQQRARAPYESSKSKNPGRKMD